MPAEIIQQENDCAFYRVEGDYGIHREPIDPHAIYGWLTLGGRANDSFEFPHRNYLRDPETAILAVKEGDRVRVNDNNWMDVTDTTSDGFVAVYENGHVEYEIWHHYTPKRLDTNAGPRMFRRDPWRSQGEVHCLEVEWNPEVHPTIERVE